MNNKSNVYLFVNLLFLFQIGPQKTAFDVCRELGDKVGCPPHELCLEEFDLLGSLERPLHHSEKVLEVVARWGYWDTEDRKDNVLILRKDRLYKDIVPLVSLIFEFSQIIYKLL